ncbi:MAG: hypothetical protein QXN40_02485 [Candidatus Bathyarchaeia archaeon]
MEELRMMLRSFLSECASIFVGLEVSLPMVLILLGNIIFFYSAASPIIAYADENPPTFETDLNAIVQVGDWLVIFILPPVDNLWVKCNASRSSDFRVSFSPKEIQYGREVSVVYAQLESEGVYNLLISFSSNNAWNGTIGVYASDRDFYGKNKPASITSQGYFIELYAIKMTPNDNKTANYRINIVLVAQKVGSSSIFNIKFPTPVNALFFALISAFIAYINIFFVLDSYFKSKREGVSKFRWMLVGVSILASLYVLYQVYWIIVGG